MKAIIFLLFVCLVAVNEGKMNILNYFKKHNLLDIIIKIAQQSINNAINYCNNLKIFSYSDCTQFIKVDIIAMIPPKGGFKTPVA